MKTTSILLLLLFFFYFSPVKAQDYQVQQAHTGAWFNLDESGHGIMLEVFNDDLALIWWFTFDPDGNRTWFGGVGGIDGDTITIDANQVSGGAFPPHFDASNVSQIPWGQIIFRVDTCGQGLLKWIPVIDGYTAGELVVNKLTSIEQLICVEPEEILSMNINYSETVPTIDGTISSGEWDDAFRGELMISPSWSIPVALMTDGSHISILFENLAGPGGINDVQQAEVDTLFPEVFIKTDPENPDWNGSTHWFHASFQDCYRVRVWNMGIGCNFSLPQWSATNWPLSTNQLSEIQISYERLGLVENESAEILLNLSMTSALLGNQVYHNWPAAAA
ncbi:MAG: hypothetical protein ACSHWU_11125, partial [Marinicella sp.]